MGNDIKDFKAMLKKKKPIKKTVNGLSTGSTLLNLACTGKINVGFLPGQYYYLVGDSSSGKTFLSLTCLAEASINPKFDNYRFIFDNAENGAMMDFKRYFGKAVVDRLEPPAGTKDNPIYSATVEEMYFNLESAFEAGKPFIYITDSMDALSSGQEEEKFQEDRKAFEKGRDRKGSYGDGKAKENSQKMRIIYNRLRKEGKSILILISQTRDNIGFGAQFNPKTRSGGRALTFYAAMELWSSIRERLKVPFKGKDRTIGIVSRVRTLKNRLSGKDRMVDIPILYSHGIDDLGGCVRYLLDEGHWKGNKKGSSVDAPEFDFKGSVEELIESIETDGREKELRLLVSEVWHEIESSIEVKRKGRYD